MSFRRNGHSDERRRRVLMDDGSAPAEAAPATKRSRDKKGRNYSDAALAAQQPPLTALIAARPWTLSVYLLSALTFIVALQVLHAESAQIAKLTCAEHIAPLQFDTPGNLFTWFSGALLGWSALLSAQIYSLRRHRVDDYRGRYRIWLWTTAVLLLASIDVVSGIHGAVGGAMAKLSGRTEATHVHLSWMAVAACVLTFMGLRMAIEMRRSRGAVAALLLAITSYVLSAAFKLHWIKIPADLVVQATMVALLTGHTLVWFSTLVYARYVYLDSQNLLVPKVKKPKKVKEEAKTDEAKGDEKSTEKTVGGKQVRIDAAHTGEPAKATTPANNGGPLKAAMVSNATNKSPVAASAGNTAGDDRKLSKAERKRLRRQGDDDE